MNIPFGPKNPHLDEDAELEIGPADGYEDWTRRMKKYFGFREHPRQNTVPRCPRVILGKRCLSWQDHNAKCACNKHHPHHLWDHCRLWRDALNNRVLTLEPYGINGNEFAQLVANVLALGLDIQVEGYSPYYPGHSVLIIIRKPHQFENRVS
jgi:hypothetical protein